jgi:WD40 repeat protein
MTDLKTRLHPMEQLQMPELWDDIERRRPRPAPEEPERRWRRVGIAFVALAIAGAALALAVTALSESADQLGSSPTIAPPLARNGVIAYGSIAQEGLFWTVRPDGSHPTTVQVDVPGFVGVPSWSPDGTRIAFTLQSNDDPHPEGGNYDIYMANADGTDPVRLTHDQVDRSPVWSPDGTRIAYVRESSTLQIWVMNADGSNAHQLTQGGDAVFPTWSPDGSQIAFVSWDGIDANIYVMNADGSDVRRLTDDPAHEDEPAWSPDSRTIAFSSEGGSRDPGIYTMAPDGAGVTELLSDPDPANLGFAWSPDGSSMAVVSIRGPGFDRTLYVLDVSNLELTPIVEPGAYFGPSWQPLSPTADGVSTEMNVVSVPDVIGQRPDEAQQTIEGVALVPDVLRGDPSAAGVLVVEQDPAPGTRVDTGSTVLLVLSAPDQGSRQAVAIDGVPFPVCRPVTIDGDFGGGMDRAWVFEEERVPGAGCIGSEGFQRLGVGSGDRVELLSDRITDIITDRAYKVWPFATPDLDGDGVDEIALAKGEAPGSRLVWFVKVVGRDLLPVVRDCGPGCEAAWNPIIGSVGHEDGTITQGGMFCEPREGGGTVLVEWGTDAADPLMVSESRWTLREQTVQSVSGQSYSVPDTDAYPPSGLGELCGSPVSLPGVPVPREG